METQLKLFKDAKPAKKAMKSAEKSAEKSTEKLEALEQVFRAEIEKKDEKIESPFTNERPTSGQQRLISKLGLGYEDQQYNLAPNKLGDFTGPLSQQKGPSENQVEAVKALNVQTLNSMSDVSRIVQANKEYEGINSQFSLNQIENRAFKKYKKSNYNKLASQFL